MTTSGALREYVSKTAELLMVIDFGKIKLFEHAQGQFNIIFILQKSQKKEKPIKIIEVLGSMDNNAKANIEKLCSHIKKHYNKENYSDEYIRIYNSSKKQEELNSKKWHVKIQRESNDIIECISQHKPLSYFCETKQGIVTGADIIHSKNIKLLSISNISQFNIKEGQGIFYLTKKEVEQNRFSKDEMMLIKKLYKASDINKYVYNNSDTYIIYTNKNTQIKDYPNIEKHLTKYRAVLENKREFKEGKLPWYSLHWARDEKIFKCEKLLCSIWPSENNFAYSNTDTYVERNIFVIFSRNSTKENLKYILGILNSSVIRYWFMKKMSRRGDKYFIPANDLNVIPIPEIDFSSSVQKESHDSIVKLTDSIIKSLKEKKEVEQNRFQSDINVLVYKLYGLSPKEIEVIESESKKI